SAMLVLPLDAVVGLEVRDEMVEDSRVINGLEMDIVKCFRTGIGRREVLRRIARKERLRAGATLLAAELKEICRTRLYPRSSRGNEARSVARKSQSLPTNPLCKTE